jgi:hypothetical protein
MLPRGPVRRTARHVNVCTGRVLAYISAQNGHAMNIFDKSFGSSEAQVRYLDADYVVLKPGNFVRCAITGTPIPLDELSYWNVDRQEAYVDAVAAHEAYRRYGLPGGGR